MSKEFTVLYFASARDATNVQSEKISLPPQSTSISLENLTILLKRRHEKLAPILENSLYAINMEYVENDDQTILVKEGDEVAVIPPVSGG
ncbi:molybdopterin synthase sulfur carrier subunit-like protein [Glomus cerebriforme]|uniref:Molybdopterin synthase sulfur carrier subunit n=1 Tax=Glomus cerebriforme TaxID=658196 RepID=A0A397TDE6_9GLOM|nr:molybdopterin synthase sulfur carrier subunit-like protein [Glomus cerebriforme]